MPRPAAVILLLTVLVPADGNWTMYGGNAARSGYVKGETALEGEHEMLWSKRVYSLALSTGTTAEGIYWTVRSDRYLFGIDTHTGKVVVNLDTNCPPPDKNSDAWIDVAPPVYANGRVFVPMVRTNNGLTNFCTIAFERNATGSWVQAWLKYEQETMALPGFMSGLAVDDTAVYTPYTSNTSTMIGRYMQEDGSSVLYNTNLPVASWSPSLIDGVMYGLTESFLFKLSPPSTDVLSLKITSASHWFGVPVLTSGLALVVETPKGIERSVTLRAINLGSRNSAPSYVDGWSLICAKPDSSNPIPSTDGVHAYLSCGASGVLAKRLPPHTDVTNYTASGFQAIGKPVVTDNAVIVSGQPHTLAFNKQTREVAATFSATGSLVLDGDVLYVNFQDIHSSTSLVTAYALPSSGPPNPTGPPNPSRGSGSGFPTLPVVLGCVLFVVAAVVLGCWCWRRHTSQTSYMNLQGRDACTDVVCTFPSSPAVAQSCDPLADSVRTLQGTYPELPALSHLQNSSPRPNKVNGLPFKEVPGFKVKSGLGLGGQGTVFKVQKVKTDEEFAMKSYVLPRNTGEEWQSVVREMGFLLELKGMDSVVPIEEIFTVDKEERRYMCVVMKYFPEGDLMRLAEYYNEKKEKVPEVRIVVYMLQVADLFEKLHSRNPPLLHRDLKPENILLHQAGRKVAVTDFGLARYAAARCNSMVGTLPYIAPEIFHSGYGPGVDLWAIGCIMYVLATVTLRSPSHSPRILYQEANSDWDAMRSSVRDEMVSLGYTHPFCSLVADKLLVPKDTRIDAGKLKEELLRITPQSQSVGSGTGYGTMPTTSNEDFMYLKSGSSKRSS